MIFKLLPLLPVLLVVSCERHPTDTGEPVKQARSADPSDQAAYLGLTLEDASALADKSGIPWRVTEVDGQPQPVTADLQPDRLNFAVADGKIIRVTKG